MLAYDSNAVSPHASGVPRLGAQRYVFITGPHRHPAHGRGARTARLVSGLTGLPTDAT